MAYDQHRPRQLISLHITQFLMSEIKVYESDLLLTLLKVGIGLSWSRLSTIEFLFDFCEKMISQKKFVKIGEVENKNTVVKYMSSIHFFPRQNKKNIIIISNNT